MHEKDELKLPYYATRSFNVKYRFKYENFEDAELTLSGTSTHALLKAGCDGLVRSYDNMTYNNGKKVYTKSLQDVNIATYAITFLYTDTTPEEGYLSEDIEYASYAFSIAQGETSQRIYGPHNFNDEDSPTKYKFKTTLRERIDAFSEQAKLYDLRKDTITSRKELKAIEKEQNFYFSFHHSEQALMHYLSSSEGIKILVNTLQKLKSAYLYGIVLDIYTQRMLCSNCNACLIGLQHSHERGFIADFNQALEKKHIQPRNNGIMVNTRVSASQAGRTGSSDALKIPNDDGKTHRYNPDNKNLIFQAHSKSLGIKKAIRKNGFTPHTFKGSFFVSREFSRAKLEQSIALDTKKGLHRLRLPS